MNRLNFFGIKMYNGRMENCINWLFERNKDNIKTTVAFANADCLNQAYQNSDYYQSLKQFDTIYPDGSGIRLATKILKLKMFDNLNGTDMFPLICQQAEKTKDAIFLFGGREGIAESVKINMQKKLPNLNIVGTQHGYFVQEELDSIIQSINQSKAKILFVAFGAPIQENWIMQHKDQLNVNILIGVGGCFDFYANRIPRAPMWMRKMGLEWIYRLKQEPKRMWKRYIIGNPLFILRIWKLGKHRMNAEAVTQFETDKLIHHFSDLTRNQWRHQFSFYFKKYAWIFTVVFARILKRSLDIIVSGLGVVVLLPILLLLIIAIKLESKGGAFYSQIRVGKYGTEFKFWKFRSMCQDSDVMRKQLVNEDNEMAGGVIFKMKNDPRITKIGKFIRKYSIDELPQLYNVFIGDMSLVGPRPAMPDEVTQYTANERKRLGVTPGITGIWQVSGRSDIPFDEQVKLDELYIQSQSFWRDIWILLKTIPAVILSKGAY